jgi:hypothetical protein
MAQKWSCIGLASLVVIGAVCAASASSSVRGAKKIPEIVSTVDPSKGSPSPSDLQTLQQISDKAQQTGRDYYGKIVKLLGSGKHPQPAKITISFNYSYNGIAATGGDHTEVNAPYALKNPNDIPGVIVHELTHVAQSYSKDPGFDTGWLTEGIADYVRWFNFEPVSKRPHPRQSRHPKATAAYQTTAAFLFWAVNKYNKNLVKILNEQLYDGTYTPETWKKLTSKSLDELNDEWVATLEP